LRHFVHIRVVLFVLIPPQYKLIEKSIYGDKDV